MKTLFECPWSRPFGLIAGLAVTLAARLSSPALTLTAGPVFVPAPLAPLAGALQLATDAPSRVSVSVNDGTNTWHRDFYDYATSHSVPLLGFKPGRTNAITVTLHDRYRNELTVPQPLLFNTSPLPGDFPKSAVWTSQPDRMEPGYTLFRVMNYNDGAAYLTIVDNSGEVVWYSIASSTLDVRQLANGDLFLPLITSFVEINMLGETVNTWVAPEGYPINFHDGVPTPHGTILYLNDDLRFVPNFPTSSTDPNAPPKDATILYNRVVEMSATDGSLVNLWPLIDLLQPTRIDYLTFSLGSYPGWDSEHANAVIEDPRDDSVIVSLRHQDAVIKIARGTGQLKWILGPHENWEPQFQPYLLTPVGTPFEWSYAQHAPVLTPQGTLLLFDDGNFRASPFDPGMPDADNYSRAVEYAIDEQRMEVAQVWDYGRIDGDPLYTDRVGNAEWLPLRGNVLVTFGNVLYEEGTPPSPFAPSAAMIRIKEVTHDPTPEVVFDLALFDYADSDPAFRGYIAYRSHRIPDLYSTLPMPVEDLMVKFNEGTAGLEFSANGARTYAIEASADLQHWTEVGTAEDTGRGNFQFTDTGAIGAPGRYYRVVTR